MTNGLTNNRSSGSDINNQNKTFTVNGVYTADAGYTGLGEVTVAVPASTPVLQDKTVSPSTSLQTVVADQGYDGLGTVSVNAVTSSIDSDIQPNNIRSGITILDVQGSLEPVNNTTITITPTTTSQAHSVPAGYTGYGFINVNAVDSSIDSSITPANIRQGATILGVAGSLNPEQVVTGSVSNGANVGDLLIGNKVTSGDSVTYEFTRADGNEVYTNKSGAMFAIAQETIQASGNGLVKLVGYCYTNSGISNVVSESGSRVPVTRNGIISVGKNSDNASVGTLVSGDRHVGFSPYTFNTATKLHMTLCNLNSTGANFSLGGLSTNGFAGAFTLYNGYSSLTFEYMDSTVHNKSILIANLDKLTEWRNNGLNTDNCRLILDFEVTDTDTRTGKLYCLFVGDITSADPYYDYQEFIVTNYTIPNNVNSSGICFSTGNGGNAKFILDGCWSRLYDSNYNAVTYQFMGGRMPSSSLEEMTVTPSASQQVLYPPLGIGAKKVTVSAVNASVDANIVPSNIVSGVSILGVQGSASAQTIIQGISYAYKCIAGQLVAVDSSASNAILPISQDEGFTRGPVGMLLEDVTQDHIDNGTPFNILMLNNGLWFGSGVSQAVDENGNSIAEDYVGVIGVNNNRRKLFCNLTGTSGYYQSGGEMRWGVNNVQPNGSTVVVLGVAANTTYSKTIASPMIRYTNGAPSVTLSYLNTSNRNTEIQLLTTSDLTTYTGLATTKSRLYIRISCDVANGSNVEVNYIDDITNQNSFRVRKYVQIADFGHNDINCEQFYAGTNTGSAVTVDYTYNVLIDSCGVTFPGGGSGSLGAVYNSIHVRAF